MHDPRSISIYCQEPTHFPREDGLRIAVIADGNGRRGRRGYAAGARNVVRCAEHCRARGDVALFCALLLSPENVKKRGQRFFAGLHALFLRLVADAMQGRALAGVRCELYGRLDRLKKRGGAARRLAHTIELLLEIRGGEGSGTRLVLGLDYDDQVVSALHLDLLVRTGMESSSAIRLSGLRSHPSAACVATMKLWCDFEPRDLDDAIAAAERCPPAAFAPGYDAAFVAGLIEELLLAELADPLRLVLPIATPARALVGMLARLEAGPLGAQDWLMVVLAPGPGSRTRRFGPKGEAHQSIVLLPPGQRRRVERLGPYTALLAPGQPSAVWRLADVPLSYASVHGCAPTPRGIVEGLRKAVRFRAAHPPREGGARAGSEGGDVEATAPWPPHIEDLLHLVAAHPRSSAEEIARALDGGGGHADRQLVADVFAAQELRWALSRGLLSMDAHWKRAALNYCYTGFAIPFRIPEPLKGPANAESRPTLSPTGARWEPLARHVTRFMLVVAASDEEVTDRVFPGETPEDRRTRLDASARHIVGALLGRAPASAPRAVPSVRGAPLCAAIAAYFEELRARFARTSHPHVFEGFCRAITGLYAANANELSPAATERPRARMRALAAAAGIDPGAFKEPLRALRVLCYLGDVAPSIGAGATFRAAALWTPVEAVTDAMAASLDRVAALVDSRFRLANDLSDLARAADRDRDLKENAWTILVPKRSSGKARERALVRAAVACDEVAAWLDGALSAALVELDTVWPSMAAMVRRGVHVGERFYALGHYADLSRLEVAAILDEIGGEDPVAPAPTQVGRGALPAPTALRRAA